MTWEPCLSWLQYYNTLKHALTVSRWASSSFSPDWKPVLRYICETKFTFHSIFNWRACTFKSFVSSGNFKQIFFRIRIQTPFFCTLSNAFAKELTSAFCLKMTWLGNDGFLFSSEVREVAFLDSVLYRFQMEFKSDKDSVCSETACALRKISSNQFSGMLLEHCQNVHQLSEKRAKDIICIHGQHVPIQWQHLPSE